ncbi:uncharacterized protein M6B38_200665 [Iris pallida]|uniref:Uncharacterized protein n=1 Tax=Iris pallida TaxID=29817 RepID=A0AAX6E8Y5_IRIPA|nr:uncharacterized protein M6B38_200665 [Iris pallida]
MSLASQLPTGRVSACYRPSFIRTASSLSPPTQSS